MATTDPMIFQLRIPRSGVPSSKFLLFSISMAGLVLVLLMPHNAPADLNSAVEAYNQGQHETAIAELNSLANAGDPAAKYALGAIYSGDNGVPVDLEKALKWFRESANQGNSSAQYSLAVLLAQGKGIPQDLVGGLMWLNIAARDPNHHQLTRLRIVSTAAVFKKLMTPAQIAEADSRAAAWKPPQP